MKKMNPKGKTKISLQKLALEGFNFDYFTNIYETKAGKKYYFCYDQGYLRLEKDLLALVERETYVA